MWHRCKSNTTTVNAVNSKINAIEGMGSKKLKKKVKVRKASKLVKLRKCQLNGKNHLSDINECHSLKTFSQVRQNYFNYLRNAVKENLDAVESESLSREQLDRISLEVEQQALLACMQSDIYRRAMIKIIHDIRKSTKSLKLNLGISDVIKSNNLETCEILERLKSEESERVTEHTATRENQVYSQIPTISSVRTNYNEYNQNWTHEGVTEYNADMTSISTLSCDNFFQQGNRIDDIMDSGEAQNLKQTDFPCVDFLSVYNCNHSSSTKETVMNGIDSISNHSDLFLTQNLVPVTSNSEELTRPNIILSENGTLKSPQMIDPTLPSQDQLQKSVENSLRSLEKIKVQRKEEIDRAKLVKLLEDDLDDEVDDIRYDSFSDNCDEPVAGKNEDNDQGDNFFADRLEEMRQIFGMEDEEEILDDKKAVEEHVNNIPRLRKAVYQRKSSKLNNPWYHERVIQMHKYAMLASEMTEEMRNFNRISFIEYFGEDSDEENEVNFQREDKYITSCKERISSWVVKYLMPFYHRKKIIGRTVFKTLGHHVSNSIIERIKYPDEWTVKYLITKFFPSNKIIIDESDVFNFRIEN